MASQSDPLPESPGEASAARRQDEPDRRPPLRAGLRLGLGAGLRRLYATDFGVRMPDDLQDRVSRLKTALDAYDRQQPDTFRHDLLALLPDLRRFAHALARGTGGAEALVQETLLKAWQDQDRFPPGTDLKAWAFTLMRDQHRS